MADLKNEISVSLAGRLARELTAAWPAFPRRRFTRGLEQALASLALMARVEFLTNRLAATLPATSTPQPRFSGGPSTQAPSPDG